MDPITMLIAGVAVVSASLAVAIKKYKQVKIKNDEIESLRKSLGQYADTYNLEDCDMKLIEKCKSTINRIFPYGIEYEFNKYETLEERKAFALTVVSELANCMEVNVDKIIIGVDDKMPNALGATGYNGEDDSLIVYFYEALLFTDTEQLVKTICHELKHCVQHRALKNNIWGYSPQRLAQYLYSMKFYVEGGSSEICYEAYENQIVEIDAHDFVEYIFSE